MMNPQILLEEFGLIPHRGKQIQVRVDRDPHPEYALIYVDEKPLAEWLDVLMRAEAVYNEENFLKKTDASTQLLQYVKHEYLDEFYYDKEAVDTAISELADDIDEKLGEIDGAYATTSYVDTKISGLSSTYVTQTTHNTAVSTLQTAIGTKENPLTFSSGLQRSANAITGVEVSGTTLGMLKLNGNYTFTGTINVPTPPISL